MSRERFGRYMVRMGGKVRRPAKGVTGENTGSEANNFGGTTRTANLVESANPMSYEVGTLDAARRGFCNVTKLQVRWPGDEFEPPF